MPATLSQQHSIPPHVVRALITAESSSEALYNLYKASKAIDSRYSMPYLCRKAKISSNGYLSDVLHGKRRLNRKYSAGIIRAFGLKGAAANYLRTLIAFDNEKDRQRFLQLQEKIAELRKALTVTRRDVGQEMPLFFFALEVFCAFGLFHNQPSREDLNRYFTSHSARDVNSALKLLQEMNLVREEGEQLELVSTQIDFSGNNFSQIEYLKLAFQHGVKSVAQWFEHRDQAVFESINVSVKKDSLPEKLQQLRQTVEEMRFSLETEDADLLLRLNLQVYPLS